MQTPPTSLFSDLAFWSIVAAVVVSAMLPLEAASDPLVREILRAIAASLHTPLLFD